MKKYKCSHCFTNLDLYDNFDFNSLGITKKTCREKRKDTKKEYVVSVFMYCLYLIMLDIVKNNITFVVPLFGNQEACFYVKMFENEKFQKMYSKGGFKGIDFLNSNFKGYQIYFQYTHKGGVKEKPIYISSKLKDIFYDNINKGKQYY